ncbi:MAG: ATP-binding cassette domain-containing protein [Metamycoplasmataceae bacterium]
MKNITTNIWDKVKRIESPEAKNPYDQLEIFHSENAPKRELIIEVKNLTCKIKTLKGTITVFENISFNLYKGEKIAFLGPNGAGKTVMVEILSGTRKATSGEIIYHFDHKKNKPHEYLGVQFQDFEFPTGLTIKDIIDFIIKLNEINNINTEEFNDILETFQLKDILDNKISKLSGGQKQRLNVFIALLNNPKVLFLDEFTTGLDIAIKTNIQNFIVDYCSKNETSLVLISHDIDAITEIVERIIILAEHQIKIDLSSEEVVKKFGSISKLLKKYIAY